MRRIKATLLALVLCGILVAELQAQDSQSAPWFFGVGTGLARLNSEGDQGFNTNLFGPVQVEFDLSPKDFDDLIQTAFGFGAYATNGTWLAQFSMVLLKLGGEPTGTLPGGATIAADFGFDIVSGEVLLGKTVYRSAGNGFALTPHVGARYTQHKLSAGVTVTDGGGSTELENEIEESWVDVLVGTSVDIKLADAWGWTTLLDAGFGGSEGTYRARTAVTWRLARHWSLSPNASFMAIDFENGTKGDTDWYLYDSNEFSWGLSLMFHF